MIDRWPMFSQRMILCCILFAAPIQADPRQEAKPDALDESFFQKSVLPVLERRCYECHSHAAGTSKGGLMLDSREGWSTGGDSGPALQPENPDQSLLIQAIRYKGELLMPPAGKLSAEEIDILERWVADGAVDPRKSSAVPSDPAAKPESGRNHWAFQPLRQTVLPSVSDQGWPQNETDIFLLASLEKHGLHPVDDADRYTWLRRVSLDLTGLPPAPDEITQFVADDSPEAFARVVDRLLDSRGYGERWARHWLDLMGYADQIGTANNIFAEHAWRYRDYVIQSFLNDKPFDQFIREQLAGDLLPSSSDEQRAEFLTATGFLLLGDLQVVETDKAKLRVDVVDQQLDKIGKSFLGMTLACARCHDHKFDPITQRDYYAVAGILNSTESVARAEWGVWSWPSVTALPETAEQLTARSQQTGEQQVRLSAMKAERDTANQRKADLEKAAADETASGTAVDPASRTARDQELKTLAETLRKLDRDILHTEFFMPSSPETFAVRDIAEPVDMQITIRGNPHALGDSVPRGVPAVITGNSELPIAPGQSGRIQLADWIVSPQNPLTARVTVNRIWQKLFGEGLVRSVDYWGTRGERPSHPELLDFLAEQFIASGWSQKQLIRHLALSHAYRLSGSSNETAQAEDPDNRMLWRMNRRRLDAEAIRDSMLAVSGQLTASGGGPGLPLEYPENTGGLAKGDVNPPSFRLTKFRPQQSSERTVYLPVIRSGPQAGPAEIRNVFDFAQPAEFVGQRSVTTVPTQSLFLMNGDLLKTLAGSLADRVLTDTTQQTDESRLGFLWLLVFNRPISDADRTDAEQFLKDSMSEEPNNPAPDARRKAWTELSRSLLASNEFLIRM